MTCRGRQRARRRCGSVQKLPLGRFRTRMPIGEGRNLNARPPRKNPSRTRSPHGSPSTRQQRTPPASCAPPSLSPVFVLASARCHSPNWRPLSLYAQGMTSGDIAKHMEDVYGTDVSWDPVSTVTDAVVTETA